MIGPAFQTVMAFNLVCAGTSYIGASTTDAMRKENRTAYSETFRIDLRAERWCSGDCKTTSPIYRIEDTRIILKAEEDKRIGSESYIVLNREDGSLVDRTVIADGFAALHMGQCERATFTGFPARKF